MSRIPKWRLLADLDQFTEGYLECLLWSSTDMSDDSGGKPLDDNYGPEDLTRKSLLAVISDCRDFQQSNEQLLDLAYVSKGYAAGYDAAHAGHDFWLTRNGHGAGFWDRGLDKNIGDSLTKAAKVYGGINPVVHRGRIYVD